MIIYLVIKLVTTRNHICFTLLLLSVVGLSQGLPRCSLRQSVTCSNSSTYTQLLLFDSPWLDHNGFIQPTGAAMLTRDFSTGVQNSSGLQDC